MPLLPPGPPAPAPIRALGVAVDWTLIGIGALMITLVFLNVIFHISGRDIAWTTELCELLMVWVTFLGGAAAARRGLHMTITEFLDMLGPANRRRADGAIQLLCLGILGLLTWYGMGIVNAGWGNELTVLHVPMALQYLALPVGAAAMAVFTLWDLVQIARGLDRTQRYGAG
ncbi:MAG: TRAP transporter small permease subunit [Betaproteobacteria bacterium]